MPESGAASGTVDTPSGKGSPKKTNKSRKGNKNRQAVEKFTGKCSELKGHVFDYQPGKNMAGACIHTLEELSKYAQGTCEKYPSDIAKTIEYLQEPTITAVTRPTPVIAQTLPPPLPSMIPLTSKTTTPSSRNLIIDKDPDEALSDRQ